MAMSLSDPLWVTLKVSPVRFPARVYNSGPPLLRSTVRVVFVPLMEVGVAVVTFVLPSSRMSPLANELRTPP